MLEFDSPLHCQLFCLFIAEANSVSFAMSSNRPSSLLDFIMFVQVVRTQYTTLYEDRTYAGEF